MSSTEIKSTKRVYSHDDYDGSFEIIIKNILALVGIRITRVDTPFARTCWNIYYWVTMTNMILPFFLDIIMIYEIMNSGDLTEENILFMMLPCMGYLVLALLKSYKIMINRDIYENLVFELRNMWPEGAVTEREHAIISKALKELNIVVKGYYSCNMCLYASVMMPPCVDIIRRALGADVPRVLPFCYWLPYDEFQPIAYEFTLALQASQCISVIWFMLASDLLFCAFLSHITTQFDLLCVRIEKLFPVTVDNQLIAEYPLGQLNKESNSENELTETRSAQEHELKKIIVRHNDLIRLSNDVETLFSFVLFVNFIYSSFIICLCGFCCVVIEKWNSFMYKTLLTTSLCQMWLLCWHGQKLLESSTRVANALYNCGWYTTSIPIRKSILIMICRSQKQVYITTYGFSVISLSSYTTIIKTSWSYFTLLLNSYSQ